MACIVNPEFELVALHLEHLLPGGTFLTVFDLEGNHRDYFAAQDRYLCESQDPNSPRMPPFHHSLSTRNANMRLNVFLVALNAEIKFQHYFRMVAPSTPLPQGVIKIMQKTIELVDCLYWAPEPGKSAKGKAVARAQRNMRRKATRPGPLIDPGTSSSGDTDDEYYPSEHDIDMDLASNVNNCSTALASHKIHATRPVIKTHPHLNAHTIIQHSTSRHMGTSSCTQLLLVLYALIGQILNMLVMINTRMLVSVCICLCWIVGGLRWGMRGVEVLQLH
jgi:hypothetical protein